MAAEQLLLPMAILASVAIASETCLTLSHLTFGGLGVSQPAYQRTREGFGVLLFWDALSYVFPASFAIAVGIVQFDQPQSWWLLWPTIVGFALHASYNILSNTLPSTTMASLCSANAYSPHSMPAPTFMVRGWCFT